ncbi:MAG: tRNA (adenosine(37)-N6)-threonylcarbamoyltransferase complex ATPase subunit type 1 TsaE [Candidatus Harrisonbacteria bacterium CG10_big_fil_rev_8_21_14_0_10_38_8]|uniref:tRNA threonylcarbamoyladenosine biosynthesis protein TsaE n=1 Tax=Candidatus Harrisonbacteria bacterium CG10_big_fil_rev_8_21_14_0_10_38_8 TaxID=1974582 RepID=A0A2M6WKK8_9BACT|nr:MAG: tRNA (adenosine(37)-N6)-threonylcarbamoyltransferase complex ATPase subunit type 1 TsaE [Candidatus Harrisonbacteria bacterium CG10_big_fil_rev_8_21_14_0_10_38_8]
MRKIKNKDEFLINADKFANKLLNSKNKSVIVGLVGDLGTGKTTFIQRVLKSFDVKEDVLSPTFNLIREYKPRKGHYKRVYHIDSYRLENKKELFNLGLKEMFEKEGTLVFIEWADALKDALPLDTKWIFITHGGSEGERFIEER